MVADPLETLRASLSDRYRVERLLGSGGMATVYLAHDLKHDRPVAIKVLRPALASALGPERFLREIQIAARLNHPHILALHDSGDAAGLLYYVMPFVDGESLHARVAREQRLPVADAVRIAREVASALTYAHHHGVVHRDIKPANILLSNGYALVADFGLARALSHATSDITISHAGLAIGSPAYMSPEQFTGEEAVDRRADIYALGCVLYELLTGDPPFTATTPTALLAQHAGAVPVPVRERRPGVPPGIEAAIARALEKFPADRFQHAAEFSEALRAGLEGVRPRALPRWVTQAALLAASAAVLFLLGRSLVRSGTPPPPALDTAQYAVLDPVGLPLGDSAVPQLGQLLQGALGRWRGVKVVDRFQVGDAAAREGDRPLAREDAARLAAGLGAGRYLRSEAARRGDHLQVRVGLFEVGKPAALGEEALVLRSDLAGADSLISAAAGRLLLRGLGGGPEAGVRGTTSLPALQAYARGQDALQTWRLESADSAFAEAIGYDPEYASAILWLPQVRAWSSAPPVLWRPLAEQAQAARQRLGARDGVLADALSAQARGDYPTACAIYRREKDRDPRRFAAWYGLATCLSSDTAVLPDPRSPSRWRFRTSYEEAVTAYQTAFAMLPSMHTAFRSDGFRRIQSVLFTSSNGVRPGRAVPPDTGAFFAYPRWSGDTLGFVPYPQAEFSQGLPAVRSGKQEAVLQQRRRFHEIALSWRGYFPNGADALEALALSLELLGDPSALDTLRRARRVAAPGDAQRVAAGEVWLRLKLALPDDPRGLAQVGTLADSLLARAQAADAPDPGQLAKLAALRGRGFLAADLGARAEAVRVPSIPRALARDGPAFWTFAALGGPRDSLERLQHLVAAAIESLLLPEERGAARSDWLSRPSSLAYPEVALSYFQQLPAGRESLAHAQAAAARQEWGEVRRVLNAIRLRRNDVPPEDVTFDRLLPEAHLFMLLGDARAAAAWLDPTLNALRRVPPQSLDDVPNVGALVRAMAFRAELADRLGDAAEARRWATPIVILWDRPDPFLEPLLRRMKDLARGGAQ